MTPWVKLDDCFSEHPKVERAGDLAAWLYVCGLQYCSRALSDGFIPEGRVSRLTGLAKPQKLADRLVAVGLWERVEGGYLVHDYGQHQRTSEQVKLERQRTAERVTRHRAKRSGNPVGNGRRNAVTNADVTKVDTERDTDTPPLTPPPGGQKPPEKIELAHGLAGYLVPVADALRRVAAAKPGAIEPTDSAVARSLRDMPNKDFLPLAADFEHYWLDGRGAGTVRKDIVQTWRNWLSRQPDVSRKTPAGHGAANGGEQRHDPVAMVAKLNERLAADEL